MENKMINKIQAINIDLSGIKSIMIFNERLFNNTHLKMVKIAAARSLISTLRETANDLRKLELKLIRDLNEKAIEGNFTKDSKKF